MSGLQRQLLQLESAGLVALAQTRPELEYLFRHSLVQEAAYASLLKEDRRELHRAVGEALERGYPDRLDELAAVLGQHFYTAGDDARALRYLTRAGHLAAKRYANAEAAALYGRAIEVARRGAAGGEQLSGLYGQRGRALELSGHYEEALATYQEMEAVARERGDARMELAAMTNRLTIHSAPTTVFDPPRAQPLAEDVLARARGLGDRGAEAKALWCLMLLGRTGQRLEEALAHGEQALAIAREVGLRELLAYTLNDIGGIYLMSGQVERGRSAHQEARALWREMENLPMLVDSLASSAFLGYFAGDHDEALALAEEAAGLAERIGNAWGGAYSRLSLGPIYRERGDMGRAIALMEECIRLADEAGFAVPRASTGSELALTYGYLGDVPRGLAIARAAAEAAGTYFEAWRGWILMTAARLHLLAGDTAAAEEASQQARRLAGAGAQVVFVRLLLGQVAGALALAEGDAEGAVAALDEFLAELRERGVRVFAPEALHTKGQALAALGRRHEARTVLEQARMEAEAMRLRRPLWPILLDLAELEEAAGEPERARMLRRQAAEVVAFIAEHVGGEELRERFLRQPRVRAALAGGRAGVP